MKKTELNEILGHFENVKKEGGSQYRADCPACGDRKRHLYIAAAPDGKILLDCKKGCDFKDIVSAAGLSVSDCFENPEKPVWTLIREHFYTAASGDIIAKKQIYDTGNGKKTAVWYRLEKGIYIKGLDGAKMPLYHLDKLLKSGNTAVIAEGEKDVETLERLGYTATTSPNGAGSKWRADFNEFFRGKNVVILADNDDVGKNYAEAVAEQVSKTAAAVKLIPSAVIYPEVKAKGDISDIAKELGDEKARFLLTEAVRNTERFSRQPKAAPEPVILPTVRSDDILERLKQIKPDICYARDDRGNGQMFADIFGDKARYNVTAKEWFVYRDGCWQEDTGGMQVSKYAKELYDCLKIYATSAPGDYTPYIAKLGRLNVRENMIKDARDCNFVRSEDFDRNIWLFNCRNGTYDLKAGCFRKHLPSDLISKMSNVYYDENADSSDFRKFLKDIMCDDGGKMRYLLKALGYSLCGDTSQECMFILYGMTTRNGKGTLMETISHLMGGEGGYAMTANPETLARKQNKDSRQASGDIARLRGARFLNVSEPDKGMVFDTALIKTLTGRDTITARHLHQREFQFVPNFKLFINTNYLPHVTDDTVFSSDRINVITFDRHFDDSEQDKGLKDRLKTRENISGIFNILLGGLKDYLENGLTRPLSVTKATADYRHQSDRQGMFISECLERDENGCVTAKQVYELYIRWCGDNNYRPENKSNFMAGLRAKGMLADSKKINGVHYRNILCGYKIADGYDMGDYSEEEWTDELPL